MVRTRLFQRCASANIEIENGLLGVCSMHLRAPHKRIVGIGSCTARVTGTSWGALYYNEEQDLAKKKFKLYCVIEQESLRIDFVELPVTGDDDHGPPWKDPLPEDPEYEFPVLVFQGSRPGSLDNDLQPFAGVMVLEEVDEVA
ncbi:KLTH0E15422p [Lachancea thermotolerans CBS 6340]|uniref:KLTH0E15422p n=1 Tax=Lachancea thermotolerans (strain ATCC 56472 / CBS 6340 / NRRL Y-8284) TaxID=559295 RepID=C5DIV2_LACTC|nr:KLTH0E15422p [Lachancea thermotolerans CBS 6340]CAR23713.1 KLTH0E15422p [Lachancea thermotolerans CBS 6340]